MTSVDREDALSFSLWHPEAFVAMGGTLPPERPDGQVLVRVSGGKAEWVVDDDCDEDP